jgi:hypothetical protein
MCLYTFASMYVFPFGQRLWEKSVMLLKTTWGTHKNLRNVGKLA